MTDPQKSGQPTAAPEAAVDAIESAPALTASTNMNEETVSKIKHRPEREPKPADYFRVFTYAKPFDVACFIAAGLASCGAGITLPLMNVIFGQLIGQFNQFAMPGAGQNEGEFKALLNKQSVYLLALFVGRFGLSYINKFAFRMMGIRLSSAIRLHYLQSLFGQTIHVLDSMPSGAAASTITATANVLQLGISEKLGVFLEFIATIIASLAVAFSYNWELTLVTSSVILFIFCVLGILLPFILKGHGRMTKAEARANSVASETFGGIRMITACGAEERITQKYAKWVQDAKKHGQFTAPLIALQFGLIFFALFSAFGLAFWYGVKQISEQRLDNVATVLIVLMSVMMIVISLERVSTPLLAVGKAMVAACEFFTVIDAPKPATGTLQEPDVTATDDIVFSNVTFAYPGRPHVKVLDDLDLSIEAGKLTAIVGPSGSGKSTIVGLIQRWYTLHDQYLIEKAVEKDKKKDKKKKDKDKGGKTHKESSDDEVLEEEAPGETGPRIELAGSITTCSRPLDDIELKWWRSQIGLVQQEPFLFNDTIYQNVAYGLVGSRWEDEPEERKRELVKEACKEAFADEFIDRLPEGYNTQVGDAGAKLSGGQRQRLAIARSVIRKPKILILDEATSAIDVRSERIVQAALDRASRNRTTITIAHRLSTIKKADRIIVLQKGKVVEEGTHDSLLQNSEGVYYGLVHAQKLSLGPVTEGDVGEDIGHEEEELGNVLSREKSVARSEGADEETEPKVKNRTLFASFGRLLYEQRSRFPSYFLTVLFAMCCAAGTPLQAYLFAKVVEVYQFVFDPPKFRSEGDFWSLMWLVLAIGVGLSYFLMGFVATHLAHFISANYRQEYFESILFQKTSYFDYENHSQGTLTSRVASDPKQLEELLGINMAMVYTAVFGLIGALIIAFVNSWKISVVALFVTVPLGIVSMYWRFRYEVDFEKMNAAVFEESSKFASESIGAFRTVAAFTLEDTICNRYNRLLRGHIGTAYNKARWQSLIFAFSDSVSIGCQALIFWYGGGLLASRELGVVNYFIAFFAVVQGAEAAGQGLAFGPNAAQAAQASNRILSTRETRIRDSVSKSEAIPDVDGGIKIDLQDVHFKYPTRDVSVFKGLNLTIEKGQFAAVVGASGCGKTSIISLLERFYGVGRGKILANGRDINEINVYEYRKNLSLVAQEATLFQGTIRDNILLGVDPASVTEEQLHQVCRDAYIHEFVVSLPDGYNTNVGSKGVSLSGGQKQRIAIARALIRNPKILLLDEATSSLDSESEKLVQAAFERAGKGRTMVVVAHRLATVQNADIIFVLGEGKLLEKGTHQQLLNNRGVYWSMCHSQVLDR